MFSQNDLKCRGFAPGFVNYKKGCTRLTVASDKVYQLLAHGRWFSTGTSKFILQLYDKKKFFKMIYTDYDWLIFGV
jgi:hypothetical protein